MNEYYALSDLLQLRTSHITLESVANPLLFACSPATDLVCTKKHFLVRTNPILRFYVVVAWTPCHAAEESEQHCANTSAI